MPSFVSFLIRRLFSILATLLIVTAILYAMAMLTPPEARAMLYFPKTNKLLTEEQEQRIINNIIERYGLNKSFPIQYANWVGNLLQGKWGYSPTAKDDILVALIQRTPASAELMLYSLLLFIPLGIVNGLIAGGHKNTRRDRTFRLIAFTATSMPPFILALVMLSIFWVGLYWFPIGQLGTAQSALVASSTWKTVTGLLTVDGLINGRPDITLDALRHLVLPVITLSLTYWAILGRVTRAATIDELDKEYILAARGRGVSERKVLWHHTYRNILVPALNSSALSAASLVTSLFVIEVIFLYNGISSLFMRAMTSFVTDLSAALGFAIYSVLVVLLIMTILDILQAIVDPRIREAGATL